MKFRFSKLLTSDFTKNVFVLSCGIALAQAINLCATPFITRLFTPETFGVFGTFMVVTAILAKVSSLCYEKAIVLPGEHKGAVNVLVISGGMLILFTLFILIVVVILRCYLWSLMGLRGDLFILWFVPPAVFLCGLFNIFSFWAIRHKMFKTIAIARVSEAVFSNAFKIVVALIVGAFIMTLISGFLVGTVIAVLVLLLYGKLINRRQFSDVNGQSVLKYVSEYKKFPLFSTWDVVLNSLSQNLVVFLLFCFFTPSIVGFYYLAWRVSNQPIILMSESIRKVYYQKAAETVTKGGNLVNGLTKTTLVLALVGVLPFSFLAFYGKQLFEFVFGSAWGIAGLYTQILSPWLFLLFVNPPSFAIYDILLKQDVLLYLSIFSVILRSVAVIIGAWWFKSAFVSIVLFGFAGIVLNIAMIGYAFVLANKLTRKILT